MEKMGDIFKIFARCSTQSSLVTNYKNWVPLIVEISTKINFASKLHFPFILVIGLKLKRESHRISIIKSKISLAPIVATKTTDLCVKQFRFIRGVQLRCFFYLEKKNRFELKRFFISGFWMVFWVLFQVINKFIKVPRVFSIYFR